MRPKGTQEELERRRRRAIALLDEGHGIRQVARMVGVAPGSVIRWRDAYQQGGSKALASKPPPHRPCKLSDKQRQRLIALLKKSPTAHGYQTELWTLDRVKAVIYQHFGVDYHPCHVWRILNGLGWSCQKPERRARESNQTAIAQWRQKDFQRIKKRQQKRS